MTLTSLLFALFASIGCNSPCGDCDSADNGNDIDDSNEDSGSCDPCSDTDDTGDTNTAFTGFLVITASVRGTSETAPVVIDGKTVGATSAPIELEPGDYAFGLGDPEYTDDGIPIHVSTSLPDTWANSSWITPLGSASVESDETVRVDGVTMNYYAIGANTQWTCMSDRGSVNTGDLTYTDGSVVDMPGIGDMAITGDGTDLEHVDFPDLIFGQFLSPSTAEIYNLDIERSYFCWSGNENQNPQE
ncbi:MAG: hypothetical protein UY72_C0003G0002 [Candidatus Uhrbacteria bacterium GW2011_GWD2_52_7]|uniref:Uncharacterized protein n=1 Tax=Candidatus Uhrbacteria bacterium GW2011_GWD2_52_7 TaxID=1618989 RepID=A0A0G1XHR2_9BACT|nr:MAG: hypothetical protein UY72_C0003G0002 [Candidatus Uhrbacteria bacterium GW2011_GWD2_52_7]